MAKKLCYAKPTRRSWPLKQGSMGDISQLKEDLEQNIMTSQREVALKLTRSVWGAHVRTPEEDELSEECVCEPPRACLCCHRPPDTVERDLPLTRIDRPLDLGHFKFLYGEELVVFQSHFDTVFGVIVSTLLRLIVRASMHKRIRTTTL